MRIGLEILDRSGSVLPTDEVRGPGVVDRVFIARAIGDLVPNTWLAFDLVNQVVNRLLKEGVDEEKIASSSALLVEQLRADLVVQRDALAQEVFEQKVRDGNIEFQLRADRLDYEIPNELEIELSDSIFFRANRQCIINLNYIKSFKPYEKVKLQVELTVPCQNQFIAISQKSAPDFRSWITKW